MNNTYFLSDVTRGLLTATEPSTPGHISKSMFIADSTISGWVLPYIGYVITSGSTCMGYTPSISEAGGDGVYPNNSLFYSTDCANGL